MTRHLILGGCGFIGRQVAYRLALNGDEVTLVDRSTPTFKIPGEAAARITWRRADLGDIEWDALLGDSEVIHHYAWDSLPASSNNDPGGDLHRNVHSTIMLLDALVRRGGGRVLFASSGGTVYGKIRHVPIFEDQPLLPITAYGAGKVAAELYLGLYRRMHGLDCRIARISNPFGAGQNVGRGQGAATTFIDKALKKETITIFGDGNVVRDYIHISDLAICLSGLAKAPPNDNYVFNVGSGVGTSLNDLVRSIEYLMGRPVAVKWEDGRSFDVPSNVLSNARLSSVYGLSARLSLEEGIQRTLNDFSCGREFSEEM